MWQDSQNKEYWPKILAAKLNDVAIGNQKYLQYQGRFSNELCEGILLAEYIDDEFLQIISEAFSIDELELGYTNLCSSSEVNVLALNLKCLFSELGPGGKSSLANLLDVHNTTISKWLAGKQRPEKVKLKNISDYFGLNSVMNLTDVPIFLSMMPITEHEKKAWIINRIENIQRDSLNRLFPAFQKLLG